MSIKENTKMIQKSNIKIFFKALLFNVVWTEIEFLNKKKKKKERLPTTPYFIFSYFTTKEITQR